jgi:beta-glucosidase-like glycosyl hydrolase/CubicO group peptidase (beta-lactamase class C family)
MRAHSNYISYRFFALLVIVCFFSFVPVDGKKEPPFCIASPWADSVIKTLSPEERIAQLFMVAAYSNKDKAHVNEIKKLITDYKIGGLIFFQGGPLRQAMLTNTYQALSKVPLLLSIDAEWGLAMRLDSTVKFPRQMTLGAIQNDSLVYQMGAEIARQCKRIGLQVNFAPDIDINNNPLNPVIGNRSFGENKMLVTRKALMYMKGMQNNKILATGKHFPGHGDTDSDSHKTLPIVNASRTRLDSLELYPYKQLIAEGLGSIMVAHLSVPALDTTPNQPSSITQKIVTGLLKDTLGFKGLVFTDALNMRGVSKFYKPSEIDVRALIAGNDVLLFAEDVPRAIKMIKQAVDSGKISQAEIDTRCLKILKTKEWAGVNTFKKIELKNLVKDLNTPEADLLNRKLTEESLTLLQNKNNILPLTNLDTLKIASLSLGYKAAPSFQAMLSNYAPIKHYGIDKDASKPAYDSLLDSLKPFNTVLIYLNNTNNKPDKNFGLTSQVISFLNKLIKQKNVIISIAANPYILAKLDSIKYASAVLMSYEDNEYSQLFSAQLIFGGIAAKGKLPVTASADFTFGKGISTASARFKYTLPEDIGIDAKKLYRIDSIALKGIKDKVYPGCQILVAKNGNVIYQKSFGYFTYDKKHKVKNDDLYDLASITKIAASTISLMKMVDEKKVSLNDSLGKHLPMLFSSNKNNIVIREMMTHQAGLRDWIPFWQRTITKTGEYKQGIYSPTANEYFSKRVANDLYINNTYEDTLYKQIIESPLKEKGKYLYSDIGYYFIKKIIEQKSTKALNIYAQQYFYAPLGLTTMTYKPIAKVDIERIAPTENDKLFRKQQLKGDVHDPGAAMLGGVGGHAGLFSNANDLAVIMQMLLNKGTYGGKRFVDSTTVVEFTKCQFCANNRRAIGFDKPSSDTKENPVCDCVSPLSFGHSGFTGTLTWADPANGLVYVFLSNRVYPDATENKLAKSGIRTRIQEVIYEAINK